jgi:hypothetical protein
MTVIKGRLHGVMTDESNNLIVSFAVAGENIPQARRRIDELKKHRSNGKEMLKIEADIWREKRSLDANAYLHVIINKIASALAVSATDIKKQLNLDYGTIKQKKDGTPAGLMLPEADDIDDYDVYAKWFDKRRIGDVDFNCYIVYKRTSELNTAEFSRLLEGAISEAAGLGIETATPNEVKKMLDLYDKAKSS